MIALTGGTGTLGKELLKIIPNLYAPKRNIFDITREIYFERLPRLIIHAAAYTDVVKAEQEKELCYQINVIGTRNLANLGVPMIYISTAYVFDGTKGDYVETDYPNPINFYSLTKLLGEYESRRTQSTVIRCLFKPRPFEHNRACTDQFTNGDYVDVIAKEIALCVKNFNRLPPTLHIGTQKRSTYELALETNHSVIPCYVKDIDNVRLPKDISLDLTLWEKIKSES